jgi:hypothetical protein
MLPDGSPYKFNSQPDNKIQEEAKRAENKAKRSAEMARRTANASISIPDKLDKIEGDLAKILNILNNK